MSESRFCWLARLHIHRADTVDNIKTIDVLMRRWDAAGDKKVLLAFAK